MAQSARQRRESDQTEWRYVRNTERRYAAWLRKIADNIAAIIRLYPEGDPSSIPEMQHALEYYAAGIEGWARAQSARIIEEVAGRDARAWFRASRQIGRALRQEVYEAPVGAVARKLVDDQVALIRSMPIDAGRRVQQLLMEGVTGGRRYAEAIQMIRQTGQVTRARAELIARTETAKAQASIVEARSRHIGVEQYRWMSVRDSRVRPHHRALHGKVFFWNDPPIAEENGERHHPGQFPNCRCFAAPLIDVL